MRWHGAELHLEHFNSYARCRSVRRSAGDGEGGVHPHAAPRHRSGHRSAARFAQQRYLVYPKKICLFVS